MTIEPKHIEEQLFAQLRVATAQRLRAADRGDGGLCVLLARQRNASLAELRACSARQPCHILHAA